jgi:hypothetical protein
VQAVIATFESQNLVATRCRARDAARVHGCFGAAGAETHHVHRIASANFFREFGFHAMRHAKRGAVRERPLQSLYHRRMPVAGHQRAETKVVVDIFVPVDILDLAAVSLGHKDRVRIISAVITGYPERDAFFRLLVRLGGFWRALLIKSDFLLQCFVHFQTPVR